jgi:hypothetical protein
LCTSTILPLVTVELNPEDGLMFDVFCSGHQSSILLGPDNILVAVNRADGVDLHWRCSCGTTGVRQFSPPRRSS